MDVTLHIHLEAAEDGSPVWWAEADELPGMTASADSLAELRAALDEVFADLAEENGGPIRVVAEALAGAELAGATTPPGSTVRQDGQAPVEGAPPARQVLLIAA